MMEAVRAAGAEAGSPQTYVYASTDYVACYNEYNKTHPVTEESFRLSPVSYGCQKACNEILISDYTRKVLTFFHIVLSQPIFKRQFGKIRSPS